MNKHIFSVPLLAAVILTACSKETYPTSDTSHIYTFEAVYADGKAPSPLVEVTKTVIAKDTLVYWSAKDSIKVYNSILGSGKFVSDNTVPAAKASFTGTFSGGVESETSGNDEFWGVYPYSAADGFTSGSVTVTLPDHQTAVEGSFGPGLFPAMAKSSDKSLSFYNVCGGVAFTVSQDSILSVTFKGNGTENIAGKASVGFGEDGKPVVNAFVNGKSRITVSAPGGGCFKPGVRYYIVAYPSNLPQGYTLTYEKRLVEGSFCSSESKSIKRSVFAKLDDKDASVTFHSKYAPEPTGGYSHKFTFWEISSDYASESTAQWISSNRLYANMGDGASCAYVCTSGEGAVRPSTKHICVSNMSEDCALNFVWPSVSVAAGSTVDFMGCFFTSTATSPKYWIFEYEDGGQWKSVSEDLRTASEDPSLKYSFYLFTSDDQNETFAQSFTLQNPIVQDTLRMRLRPVGKYNTGGGTLVPATNAYVGFVNSPCRSASIDIYQGVSARDSKKVLQIGNSFSYYYGTAFVLKELAMSQGHSIRLRAFNKASQTLSNHSQLEKSLAEVKDGDFDCAIIQDQSAQHSSYAEDPVTNAAVLEDTKAYFSTVKSYSPSVKLILENTWAYAGKSGTYMGYGNYDNFDKLLQEGTKSICSQTGAALSPIGIAFRKARLEGITDLYHTDSKHPNRNGVYLKACVNYLMLYGERFNSVVPDMLVDASTAARLRQIAEEVVLDGVIPGFFSMGEPDVTSFGAAGGEGCVSVSSTVDFTATTPQSWVKVTSNTDKVSWTVAANAGEASRSAVITIAPDGLPVQEINIFQAGNKLSGGIATAAELLDFASKVNSGEDYGIYVDASGEVALNADIDLTGKAWTPIGLPSQKLSLPYNELVEPTENPFKGTFNGNGHTIKGLSMSVDIQSTQFYGLFATTSGATIKNLNIEGASLVVSGNGISASHADVALLVGYCYGGKVSEVTVNGTVSGSAYSAASRQVGVGGICGMISNGTVVEKSTFSGSITTSIEEKYTNKNTVNMGGICGASIYKKGVSNCKISACTNNALIDVQSHRAAGIISTMFYTDVEGCTNNGNVTCDYPAGAISVRGATTTGVRIGGIVGYCSQLVTGCTVTGCCNYATIRTEEAESITGGMAGLIRCNVVTSCSNAGTVIGPEGSGKGLLVGTLQTSTDPSSFASCKLRGKIGSSESTLTDATADNYLDNGIGITIVDGVSCPSWSSEQISFWEE